MINTLMYAKKLEDVGIPREQAETHAQIMSEIVEGDLATKQDLNQAVQAIESKFIQFDNKLVQMEYRMIIKSGAVTATVVALGVAILALVIKS